MATVAFATLGCRLNQVDSRELQATLEARGFRTVDFDEPADVVVVNTCTVTARAELSDRQMIRRARRLHPGARVIVTGCWAQTSPGAVALLPGVDLVVGNADKARLAELVDGLFHVPGAGGTGTGRPQVAVSPIQSAPALTASPPLLSPRRSRAFVKVQDGCQHRCAFCVVPLARGVSRSLPVEDVLGQVRAHVSAGHREVVLTGVDLGHYGSDLSPRRSLAALLGAMIGTPGLRWIRLSSVLPAYVTPELLDILAGSSVIAPHFHVPLQSGSDRVLRRMRRPYTVRMYRAVVERLVAARPSLGLGADVIVGFPGESARDFEETMAVVEQLPFSYLHVFPYSLRPGTEAAALTDRVHPAIIARRGEALRELARQKNRTFRARLVGGVEEVIVLETRDRRSGRLTGLTGSYVEVVFDGPERLMREMTRVRVTGLDGEQTLGVWAAAEAA